MLHLSPPVLMPSGITATTFVGEGHGPRWPCRGVLVVFKILPIPPIIQLTANCKIPCEERNTMHDLLIALAFIGMVVAPAIVAATTDIDLPDKTK